ncbi:MAG: type II toxin-antitoxin system HicA family toxin [Chloroflexota bacterium]|nr:type II toxin-antitoxin system HicA family toxin [Chloroflexota bacterium]
MSRLRPLPGESVVKALQKAGFDVVRQSGSHVFLRHPDGRATVVPVHKGEDLGRGILRKIIHDAELTREEFLEFLKSV